jgi:hypothetical protein
VSQITAPALPATADGARSIQITLAPTTATQTLSLAAISILMSPAISTFPLPSPVSDLFLDFALLESAPPDRPIELARLRLPVARIGVWFIFMHRKKFVCTLNILILTISPWFFDHHRHF